MPLLGKYDSPAVRRRRLEIRCRVPYHRRSAQPDIKDTPMSPSPKRRHRRTVCFAIVVALAAAPALAGGSRIYITNSAGDSIHVIDPATNKVVQVIGGIEAPHGIGFSPDGARIYVSNEADETLDVIDRASSKVTRKVALSGHPNNIAVTRDGRRVIVGIRENPGALDIIDTQKLERVASVPVKGALHNVYLTPDDKYAVTGSIRGKILTVIDLKTEQPVWEVKFDQGVRPMTIEAAPDGSANRIFVELSNVHGFAVVDVATRKEVARITLPDRPSGFGENEERTGTPAHGIGVAPDGRTLWVNSTLANAVFVYALPGLELKGHVSLPVLELPGRPAVAALPDWITFTPDSKQVYISNSGIRSVSVIDAAEMKVIASVPVGEVPKRINTLVTN
jgi:YVTN family beta-propeller protein